MIVKIFLQHLPNTIRRCNVQSEKFLNCFHIQIRYYPVLLAMKFCPLLSVLSQLSIRGRFSISIRGTRHFEIQIMFLNEDSLSRIRSIERQQNRRVISLEFCAVSFILESNKPASKLRLTIALKRDIQRIYNKDRILRNGYRIPRNDWKD